MYQKSKIAFAILACLQLSSCGSSSDKDKDPEVVVVVPPEPVNAAPSIVLENATTQEKETVTIASNVTDDGSIVSYLWTQTSGLLVDITGADTDTISFVAPNISANEDLVFELTATDDAGAESSASATVSVEQKFVGLNFSGLVTDSPIANAAVTVMVGEQAFEFTADDAGAYSAALTLDDDQINQMVSVIAQGIDNQQQVKLMSILGSVDALINSAGEDETVDKSENFNVNVTNFSTSQAALVLRENLGQAVQSDQQLSALISALDGEKLVFLAIALKVAIDKAGDNPALQLPAEFEDTLALALDSAAIDVYVDAVRSTAEFGEAAGEMLSDVNVTDSTLEDLATSYYFIGQREYVEFDGSNSNIGTGTQFSASGAFSFDYVLADNLLTTNYGDNGQALYSSSEQREVAGQLQYVEFDYILLAKTYQQISSAAGVTTFRVANRAIKHFPNGEFSDEEDNSADLVQARSGNDIADFVLPTTETTVMSLPIPDGFFALGNITRFESDEFTFNGDSTGTTKTLAMSFTWNYLEDEIAEGKSELLVKLESGTSILFTQLTSSEQSQYYAASAENSESSLATIGLGGVIDSSDKFDLASAVGIYELSVNDGPLDEFWWELWPNGNAYTVSTFDNNGDGFIANDEISVQYGDWSVSDQGVLSISRWKVPGQSQLSGCFGDTGECYLYNDRQWQLIGQDCNVLTITNFNDFDGDNDGVFETKLVDNRKVYKVDSRPVSDAGNQYLPESEPKVATNLLSPENYFDQTWYGIEMPTLFDGGDTPLYAWTVNQDLTFSRVFGDNPAVPGVASLLSDNSLVLTYDEGGSDRFAYLLESGDVLLGTIEGYLEPYFKNETLASDFQTAVLNNTPVLSMAELQDKEIFWLDEDSSAELSFVKFSADNQLIIYADESFSQINETGSYTLLDDGTLDFVIGDEQGRIIYSLATDDFSILTIRDSENDGFEKYIFTDFETAKYLVDSLNIFR